MPKVTGLFVFPVKSMGGMEVDKVHIGSTGGVTWDRNWLVTREDGRFLTQRQLPKMALIETSLPAEVLCAAEGAKLPAEAALTLKTPGMEPCRVLLEPAADLPTKTVNVTCWEWAGTARDEGDFVADWLSEVLGKPVRLVRYMGKAGVGDADKDSARRPVDPDFGEGYENTFSDGFPIHMTAEESLVDLNKRLNAPLPMNRFRANIVLAGGERWAEDEWAGLRIGGLEFASVKPCGRCKVTTTDQATAEVGTEPLKTLGEFRSGRVLGWNARSDYKRELMFGWNLVTSDRGVLTVADEVVITRMRPANELVV